MTTQALTAEPQVVPARRDWPELAGHLVFATCGLASAVYLLYLGRHTSFFYDEWSWIQSRRGWRPGNFLAAHNGHFVALPVLAYHLLFATAGLRAYLPYRLLLMFCHLAACFALYRYGRIRLGPLVAVLPAVLLLLLGAAWQTLLWPFQITFIGGLAFGLTGFLILDAVPSRRRNVLGCLCLTAAIACSGTGLAMLAGAFVRVALRRQWRRWWVPAVPTVVFGLWYLHYGRADAPPVGGSASQLWQYFHRIYQSSIAGLTGHTWLQDRPLASWLGLAIVLLVAGRLAVELTHRRLPVDLLSAIATGVVLWGLTALTRVHTHDYGASRYLYGGVLVVLLAVIEAVRGVRLPRLVGALRAVATAASVWAGSTPLRGGAASLTAVDTYARADFAALEHSRPAPRYQPNPRLLPVVTAAGYFSAVHSLGSPALSWSALPRQSAGVRADADRVLRQAGALQLLAAGPQPVTPAGSVTVPSGVVEPLTVRAGCQLLQPQQRALAVRLSLPAAGITLSDPVSAIAVRVRRFGPALAVLGSIGPRQVMLLRPLPDGSPVPWLIQLSTVGTVRLCQG
ncbi:MAG TPA: hypothetical protein VFU36_15145 [Jatrophihabitans sp.]|nr:hypothetical protein [Jatrophihabitans sp.]